MRVQDYEYNEETEGEVSQKRGEELISAIEMKIRKNSVAHFEILKIAKNDEEDEFLYKYLNEKGIDIRGVNITMEDVEGYEKVSKKGVNYYDLPDVLTPQEELELFEKLNEIKGEKTKKGIDYLKDAEYQKVRNQIAEANLRLVKYITTFKAFRNVNIEPDDLLSYGYRGLNNAIDKFDHTMGYKFSTYAWVAIYRGIERGIANEYGVNQNQYLEYREMQDIKQLFLEETGREPTAEELKNILGFGMKKIEALNNLDEMIINFDSLETEVFEDNIKKTIDEHHDSGRIETIFDGEDNQYYEDGVLIEAEHENDAMDPENEVEEKATIVVMKKKVEQILETLTPREAEVLRMRFGLRDGSPKTLEEVGNEFYVTRERVRQIEAKALRKLRHPARSKHLKDF